LARRCIIWCRRLGWCLRRNEVDMKLEPNNYWWAFLAGGCLLISCFTHSVSKLETLVTSKQSVEIRLDYVPFNTPTAQFIALQGESIRSIQYSPYQLTIKSMAEGQLRNKDLTGLLTRLNDRTVREAFQQKDFTGAGLSRGNQVVLSVTTPDGVVQECYGFEAEMPEKASVRLASSAASGRLPARPIDPGRPVEGDPTSGQAASFQFRRIALRLSTYAERRLRAATPLSRDQPGPI
jgi:hypothetical protein